VAAQGTTARRRGWLVATKRQGRTCASTNGLARQRNGDTRDGMGAPDDLLPVWGAASVLGARPPGTRDWGMATEVQSRGAAVGSQRQGIVADAGLGRGCGYARPGVVAGTGPECGHGDVGLERVRRPRSRAWLPAQDQDAMQAVADPGQNPRGG
jgi:hypothetical protein